MLTLAISLVAPNSVDAINRDKIAMIEEIDRRIIDLDKELEKEAKQETKDKKAVLTLAKNIISTQDAIAKETAKENPNENKLTSLNQELANYIDDMKLYYPIENDASVEIEAEPDFIVSKILNLVPEALAADDYWYLTQNRTECQSSTAVASGSITAYASSVTYYASQYYPGSIWANSNCSGGDSDLIVHTVQMWDIFTPGNVCYHDWDTTFGSVNESCDAIQDGDIVILTSEGFYQDSLMYWPYPMTDSFWL